MGCEKTNSKRTFVLDWKRSVKKEKLTIIYFRKICRRPVGKTKDFLFPPKDWTFLHRRTVTFRIEEKPQHAKENNCHWCSEEIRRPLIIVEIIEQVGHFSLLQVARVRSIHHSEDLGGSCFFFRAFLSGSRYHPPKATAAKRDAQHECKAVRSSQRRVTAKSTHQILTGQ